jgi:hypothetical protein
MDDLKIEGATLLSVHEAETLLPKEGRVYSAWWWLRSPGTSQNLAADVIDGTGGVYGDGSNVIISDNCVRPALKISSGSSGFKIGDTFSFGGKTFKIISDDLAFCLEDIGICCFRKDYKAFDANIYGASDVKIFIDAWFDKALREYKYGRLPLASGTD